MMRRQFRLFAVIVVCALLLGARRLSAQADVIRGRVTTASVDNSPIRGVQVTATSLSGGVNRTATTNNDGRFQITFPGGDGDYWVTFAAIGYAPRRFEVKRLADEAILIADARLTTTNMTLDTIVSQGGNRRRPDRNGNERDVSGTERSLNTSLIPPDQMGDLAAMAATLPGVQFIPGTNGDPSGFSVLGLSTDQNLTTLNGLGTSLNDLPRDAGVTASFATSPYDVSQGGFSGAGFNLRTIPGSNYFVRSTSIVGNAPQAEWTDAAGSALGQKYFNGNMSGRLSGPISLDKAFYNVSYQLGRRGYDYRNLLNTDPLGLQTAGVSADSAARLLGLLQTDQIPATVSGIPSDRLNDQALVFGSFDFAPPSSSSGQALNLTFQGVYNRAAPMFNSPMQVPAANAHNDNWGGSLRLRHTNYFGFLLSETDVAVSANKSSFSPYLTMPGGNVLVHSDFSNGASGVGNLQFGGNQLSGFNVRSSIDFSNSLSWFSDDNKHRVKLTSEVRHDHLSAEQSNNLLGTYSFNSLVDFQAGTPASFTRQLTPINTGASEMVAAFSLGDSYRPIQDVQIVYGVRADANWFTDRPQLNADVATAFGRSNDYVPNGVYISPRLGFSWTYGTQSTIGAFTGAARAPRGVIRGGIGFFQNQLAVQTPLGAIASTGLANGVQTVNCLGAAVPTPDWSSYAADVNNIPTTCANGTSGTVFSNAAPSVTLFSPEYAAQKSVRSTLQWSSAVLDNRFVLTTTGTVSLNYAQSAGANYDLNFNDTTRFTLPDEANRPVYVNASSIVPTTGAAASRDSRLFPQFNRVMEQRSNLESRSTQLQVNLAPLSAVNSGFTWGLTYTLQNVHDQVSGFSSTAGDPLTVADSRASGDIRHQIQAQMSVRLFDLIWLRWVETFNSGAPYTPTVASDINGDGFANDRAFVANPATTNDANLSSGMTSLLAASSSSVKDCLQSQFGQIAARNSCEGPWTTNGSFSITFNPLKLKLPQRANLSFTVNNPFGAADLILHGENNLQGWGQNPSPDSRLLVVHGFDAAAQRYTYEVNQRFGSTSQAVSAIRSPVTLTMLLSIDIGPTRERQGITQTLDRGRTANGAKMSEAFLKQIYGSGGIINPLATILSQADSLKLTGPQADSVATMNRWYVIHLDSLWTPVAHFYANLPDNYDQDDVYERYRHAREASVDLLMTLAPAIKNLLTPSQYRQLPDLIAAYLDHSYLEAIRSGTSGSPGGVFAPGGGNPGGFFPGLIRG